MTRTAPGQADKEIEAAIAREATVNMPIDHAADSAARYRWSSSSVLTNIYALALGVFCGRHPSTATLAFAVTAVTGIIMIVSKAFSNERAPITKTNGEGESGKVERVSFRTALQTVPTIGSLVVLRVLVPWHFSFLVVGFIIPMWLFVEHEIHRALNTESYLPEETSVKLRRGK